MLLPSPNIETPTTESSGSTAGRQSDAAHYSDLLATLRRCDPLRGAFDVAVRRYVRAERSEGRELDEVLASLQRVLRTHIEPEQPENLRVALRTAVLWFAVSEYHRAD